MAQGTILPDPSRLHLLGLSADEQAITAQVTTMAPEACCPLCQQRSTRVHSHYVRQVADLPWHGLALRWRGRVRRFFCDHPACQRAIFTERLPGLLAPSARKTVRLAQVLELIGLVVGGEAGSRLLPALGMAASPDTLVRLMRRASLASLPTPRVLSVDAFAFRRGGIYGTILLALERHQLVDLLPDRTAETEAELVAPASRGAVYQSRSRRQLRATSGRLGAPAAVQIADRFHIRKNLTESLDQGLLREHRVLEAVAKGLQEPELPALSAPAPEPVVRHRPPRQVRETTLRRERRPARYAAVLEAQQQGHLAQDDCHPARVSAQYRAQLCPVRRSA